MFPKPIFPNDVFTQEYFPSGSSVTVFKTFSARDGIHLADTKFSGERSSFDWTREKDVVKIQEVNNGWDTETGKLPPR
jgi:hypothetical protein